jgi:hypothetical protein
MTPVPKVIAPLDSPTNIAQVGMGWNLATGTVDLGLELFDAILVVGAWIQGYVKHKAIQANAADILRRGKRRRPVETRSLQNTEDNVRAYWT